MLQTALVALLLLPIGCSSPNGSPLLENEISGPGSVNGTIEGKTMHVSDAISLNVSAGGGLSSGLILSSVEGLCDSMSKNHYSKNAQQLLILLGNDTATPAPGTYRVDTQATILYSTTDGTCEQTEGTAVGVSGTVTLSSVNQGAYSGSLDVVFDLGEHVTGTFNTNGCPGATFEDPSACS